MYGYETWTIGDEERKGLKAFEMSWYKRILKIKWVFRITNEEVLEQNLRKENTGRIRKWDESK